MENPRPLPGKTPSPKDPVTYREKMAQTDREALATLAASLAILAYFWVTVFLFRHSASVVLGMPLWFVLSCVGGYLLSIILVWLLVRLAMRNFALGGEREG